MAENLYNSAHKANSDKYRDNWDKIFGKKKMMLFSYGTLMSDQSRNTSMTRLGGKKLIEARVNGFGLYANSDHPTVRKEEGSWVLGEIWEFDIDEEDVLAQLDMIEGYPSYYGREKMVIGEDEVWVYIMTDEAFESQLESEAIKKIKSGDWKNPKPKRIRRTKKK